MPLNYIEKVEKCKSVSRNWKEKIPANNGLLTAAIEVSKSIKEAKNNIIDKFHGKGPHKILEQCVNDELKEMIVEETYQYATQKNKNSKFSVANKMILDCLLCINL